MNENGKKAAIVEEIREAQSGNLEQYAAELEARIETGLALLARYRLQNDEARTNLIRLIKEMESAAEYQFWSQAKANAERELAEMDRMVRADILTYLDATGEKPAVSGTGTRTVRTLSYDVPEAIAWCMENLPGGVALNRDLFEKHARAVLDTAPLAFVTVHTQMAATIAADLSSYLNTITEYPEVREDGFPE